MSVFRKLLFPFAILYDGVTFIRNKFFDSNIFKSTEFDIPVIAVGNLSVGGTGKTPQIEYLIKLLQGNNKIAVLSRGYGRKTQGFLLADSATKVEEVGDEPFQFYNKFERVHVAVDEDRVHGIGQLQQLENPPEVVLLDDAYQHRKVKAKLYVLLTPYGDLYVDDFVLPAGNLREGRRGANRAEIVLVTKCPNDLSLEAQEKTKLKLNLNPNQYLFFTTIKYADKLNCENESLLLSEIKGFEMLLVTGIANPMPLVSFLESKELEVTHLKFSDHHDFSKTEISTINSKFEKISSDNKILLTTEKDYMRLKSKLEIYYISIESSFLKDGARFDKLINSYVE